MLEKKRFIIPLLFTAILLGFIFLIGFIVLWIIRGSMFDDFTLNDNLRQFVISPNTSSKFVKKKNFINDRTTLIDLQNFSFIINNNVCNKTKPIILLILVHSAPVNLQKRNAIRETWGQQSISVITLFLVGISSHYKKELIEENSMYKDLIQGNFVDVYRNITYKHVMGLKWVTYYCSGKFLNK